MTTDHDLQDIPPLRIEAAYSGDKLIGYTLATSGTEGTNRCLVWVNQVGMPGIRLGDHFVPCFGEQIEYRPVPLEAPAQPAAPQGGAYADWAQLRSALAMLMLGWGRNPNQNMEACNTVLDSATEPGMPLAILRSAPDWRTHALRTSHGQAPAATVIKKGADRQWMSERLGHLPDGIYSLYLAPTAQPAPAATPQADSQPSPVSANHADLPPLPDPDMRDVGTTPGGIKEFLRGYATEYAKAAIAARAPADSVTAPAAGAVAGPVEQQVQRIGKELLRSEQMHAAKPDRIASALRAMSESMHTDYKQEIGSNNCMQCCVAYMLGMPISQVPHFAQSNDPVACWDGFQSFIAKQGYTAVMLPGDQRPESHYLASGKSARGTSHMVVMHDGKLLHDPHPTNAGLVDVQCIWLLAKSAAAPTPAAQGDAEDAARWRHFCARHPVTLVVTYFGNGCINKTIEDAVAAIDAERAALAQKDNPQ